MTSNVNVNNIAVPVPDNSSEWGSQLKFFYLHNNLIQRVVKSDFQRLPELTHLHLGHNLITDVDPHAFEANAKLWKLFLNDNKLTFPKGTEFLIVPSLGWIELKNCSISDLPVNVFKNMSNLVFVRLSYNKIEQLDNGLFSHLRKLRYLHLEGNRIKRIDPKVFKPNHHLQWLYLRDNPLNQSSESHFLHAPSLLSLDISFCNITEIPNKFFSNLHDLLTLKLNNNLLRSFNMKAVPQNLENLDISGNPMTTITVPTEVIRQLTSLRHFDLTNNSFTCDCRLFDLRVWCEKLRTGSGGESSCDEFCPSLKDVTCEERGQVVGGETAVGNVHTRMNTVSKEIDEEPEKSDGQGNDDVERVDGPRVLSGKEANKTSGKLEIGAGHEDERSERVWSIITYSCIGVFGGMCLIGAVVLVTDMCLGHRKSRNKKAARSASSSPQNVRLEFMDPIEDRQETTPLSLHRGFDFVSQPTNAHRNCQPGQLRHS
jgi:Leucine-rich repeat (LRR) protein